ncbi:MAG: SCO family protein [Bacteroidia bacterium]|nr:SCO family protein [Bacteroidia bacterium]
MSKSIFSKIICCCLILSVVQFAQAQKGKFDFSEEKNVYNQIADVPVLTKDGTQKLSVLYSRSPLIVALIFTRCTGICSPLLLNLSEQISHLHTDPKENFKVLVISFDPRDQFEDMARMAKQYARENDPNWIFAVTPQISELTSSLAFNPVWDEDRQQFDHEALLSGINTDGYVTKNLIGLRDQQAIYSLIKSINNEFILSYPLPGNNNFLSCFSYDPSTGKKSWSWGMFLLVLPAIIAAGIVTILVNQKKTLHHN